MGAPPKKNTYPTFDLCFQIIETGEDAVEGGHEDVRHDQVQQEVVGHAPHVAVCWK